MKQPALLWVDLGTIAYADAHRLQERCVAARLRGFVPDLILHCEHEPIITMGRSTPAAEPLPDGVERLRIERGGEATWHGPGQIVLYPIRLLTEGQRDLHRALRESEEVVLRALARFGIDGRREVGKTGVWVGAQKICSLGLAVRRWVTWHGLALNYRVDPEVWRGFNPCGLDASVMSDLATVAGAALPERSCVVSALRTAAESLWGPSDEHIDRCELERRLMPLIEEENR